MPKGKGNKPLLDQSVKDQATLKVLKNDDPEVEDVLGSASHVTLYGFDLDAQAWSRKNVEGTLFVVKRRVEPRFQFVVLNRLSSENCREDLLGAFEFELSPPYLLYRSPTEVNGIWFYRQEECDEISALFDKITGAFGADAAPSGIITPAECASVMERLCVVEGAPQLQTMQSEFTNSLPPAYASAGRRRLANVARLFKFGDSPYVEWRALAISVLAAMYPAILDAKPETVAASAAQLRAPAKAGKRVFAQARKLWFLPSGGDPLADDEEDAFAAGQRTWGAASLAARTGKNPGQKKSTLSLRAPSGDVAAANVMAGLAECFGAPGVDGEVDIVSLALHLCVSATPELGAGKAVEVARWLIDPEAERARTRVLAKEKREKERAERRARDVAEGRAIFSDDANENVSGDFPEEDEEDLDAPLPPMDYKEKRAAWCAAAGPGAMSEAAVALLRKKDVEGKDVDLPAMAVASSAGGAAPLLGIATRKWFNRYGFKDCHAVVMM